MQFLYASWEDGLFETPELSRLVMGGYIENEDFTALGALGEDEVDFHMAKVRALVPK